MFDRAATAIIKPGVDRLARLLVGSGVSANQMTLLGFGLGIAAAVLVAVGKFQVAARVVLASPLCDALDGAMARQTQVTDAGGFLDIALDFLFYASMPLAFALADPPANALPAAVLLAAFIGTMSSFLAFAVMAAKRNMRNLAYPDKSFYFLGGLTEATETLAFMLAMCVWPQQFATLAYLFAALCAITMATRIWWGWRAFSQAPARHPETGPNP